MDIKEKLERLIKDEILVEVEDYIDELFEIIASKKDDEKIKEELAQMQDMKKDFELILEDLENGEIDDEEAQEILEEIENMIDEEGED